MGARDRKSARGAAPTCAPSPSSPAAGRSRSRECRAHPDLAGRGSRGGPGEDGRLLRRLDRRQHAHFLFATLSTTAASTRLSRGWLNSVSATSARISCLTGPISIGRLSELAEDGDRVDADPRRPAQRGLGARRADLDCSRRDLGGAVDAVEGPNEFDTRGGPSLDAPARRLPAVALRGDQERPVPGLAAGDRPLGRPSPEPGGARRHLRAQLDYGNIHSYPDGNPPESNLTSYLRRAATNSGSKPVMATETGYHTALNWTGEHNPVSEAGDGDLHAADVPRVLQQRRRPEPTPTSWSTSSRIRATAIAESNFGLLRNDLSEKPAFTALRNTIEILKDPGPAFTPASGRTTRSPETGTTFTSYCSRSATGHSIWPFGARPASGIRDRARHSKPPPER